MAGGHLVAVSLVAFVLPMAAGLQSPSPAVSPPAVSPPAASPPADESAKLGPEEIRARERMILVAISSVLHAERGYAAANGSFFDEVRCLTQPGQCLPAFPADGTPFLDPTYPWLEPRLGYTRTFHPGPRPTAEEIARVGASPTSLKAFAFTAAPLRPGETGTRAFCGDSGGRMCFTPKGTEPPVKEGRCEPCQKLQ
jgi:hypothetical protein